MKFFPYGRHSISRTEIRHVRKVLQGDWLTTGPKVREFEQELESYLGVPATVVSSGTAALHCAYAAIGLKSGDEVITPPLTFVATQATAELHGAKVVFSDVDPNYGLLDPVGVQSRISSKTKAIVTVDYAGVPSPLRELRELADKHGLFLIEDAAHSLGSVYEGKRVGGQADLTTFSFFPTKNITTGEGGAISSPHPDLLNRAREFSRQGLVRDSEKFHWKDEGMWHQEVHQFGTNYRLNDLGAALGISQLRRIFEFQRTRDFVFDTYHETLAGIPGVVLPWNPSNTDPMWHLFPIRVPKEKRRVIFEDFRSKGVGVQVNYFPVHLQPVYLNQGFKLGDFPKSEEFYFQEISLPMHANKDFFTKKFFKLVASILSSHLN